MINQVDAGVTRDVSSSGLLQQGDSPRDNTTRFSQGASYPAGYMRQTAHEALTYYKLVGLHTEIIITVASEVAWTYSVVDSWNATSPRVEAPSHEADPSLDKHARSASQPDLGNTLTWWTSSIMRWSSKARPSQTPDLLKINSH